MTLIRDHRLLILALVIALATLLLTVALVDHHAFIDQARSSWGSVA